MNAHQPSPARYVAYYRVSTQKQGQSGLGLDAQKKATTDFLQQYGGQVVAEFVEVESGKRSDRPEFKKAADYAELANATLLVAKLDRLSRDLHFITSLQKRGIHFKLADYPSIDQLTIHILAAMAEHEARMISLRTKSALAIAKERGTPLGNPWLDAQRNLDNTEANIVRLDALNAWKVKILKVIRHIEQFDGIRSCKGIAEALNDRGLSSYWGKPFSIPIVSRLRRESHSTQHH